ncbi:MAG: serine hydrolase [bacterium]|nr:serine hydrolase [bacterium]
MKSLPKRLVRSNTSTLVHWLTRGLVSILFVLPVFYILNSIFIPPIFAQDTEFSQEIFKQRVSPAKLKSDKPVEEFLQPVYATKAPPQDKNAFEKIRDFFANLISGSQGFVNFIRRGESPSWGEDETGIGLAAQDLQKSLYPAKYIFSSQYLARTGTTTNLSSQYKDILEGANLEKPDALTLEQVNQIIKGSPIEKLGQRILDEAKRTSINPVLFLTMAWSQTQFGALGAGPPPGESNQISCYAIVGNSFSLSQDKMDNPSTPSKKTSCPFAKTAGRYYVPYDSYEEAITGAFQLLRDNYLDKGFTSVATIENRFDGNPDLICENERYFIAFSKGYAPDSSEFKGTTSLLCNFVQTALATIGQADFIVGKSVGGLDIVAYKLGQGPKKIAFIGGIHEGNPPNGEGNSRDFVERAIVYFKQNPGEFPADTTAYFVPTMNPDGQAKNTLCNANRVNLNRNWGSNQYEPGRLRVGQDKGGTSNCSLENEAGASAFSEPENRAVRDFLISQGITKAIWYHSALNSAIPGVVSYPNPDADPPTPTVFGFNSNLFAAVYAGAAKTNDGSSQPFGVITGDASDWFVQNRGPALVVEFSEHNNIGQLEFENHINGMKAAMKFGEIPEEEKGKAGFEARIREMVNDHPGKVAVTLTSLETGESVSINGGDRHVVASTIKIFVLLSVLKDIEVGKYTLSSLSSVSPLSSVENDINLMMNESDNNAASRLIQKTGVATINFLMQQQLGMRNSSFSTWLHIPGYKADQNYFTSNDVSSALAKLYDGQVFPSNSSNKTLALQKMSNSIVSDNIIVSHNRIIPRLLPGGTRVAHKIGFIPPGSQDLSYIGIDAHNDAGIVLVEEEPFIVVFLSQDNETIENYNSAARLGAEISREAYDYFTGEN